MADQKISELTAITGANTADDDLLVIVDTSTGETKKITLAELEAGIARGDMTFGDNQKAIFGAGSDLQIWHSGTSSYIKDAGTGNLNIQAENLVIENTSGVDYITGINGGAVTLFNNGSAKLATTSTGIDVTGTATMDGLTVDNNNVFGGITLNGNNAPALKLNDNTDNAYCYVATNNGGRLLLQADAGNIAAGSAIELEVDGKDVAKFNNNGDISFYEDTGTTAKFFWDASAESLGIGTSSPSDELEIASALPVIRLTDTDTSAYGRIALTDGDLIFQSDEGNTAASSNMRFEVDGSEAMRITSAGNVGIGTASPVTNLQVYKATGGLSGVQISNSTHGSTLTDGLFVGVDNSVSYLYNYETIPLVFGTNNAERMRLDSSGNLLVGKTSADDGATAGLEAQSSGALYLAKNAPNLYVNRLSTDGEIISIRKDGTTVGSIGSRAGVTTHFVADPRSGGSGITCVGAFVRPTDNVGTMNDGVNSLGSATYRFKDLYLSGGVYLGGTGAANHLDDYEEGTWTPVLADASSGGNTGTAGTLTGSYVKVGRNVTLHFYSTNFNTSGMTGSNKLYVRNLPFNITSGSVGVATGTARLDSVTFTDYVTFVTQNGTSYGVFSNSRSGLSDTLLTVSAFSSGVADIYVSISYTATA